MIGRREREKGLTIRDRRFGQGRTFVRRKLRNVEYSGFVSSRSSCVAFADQAFEFIAVLLKRLKGRIAFASAVKLNPLDHRFGEIKVFRKRVGIGERDFILVQKDGRKSAACLALEKFQRTVRYEFHRSRAFADWSFSAARNDDLVIRTAGPAFEELKNIGSHKLLSLLE